MFNATFNNISVISWRLVLLVEEAGVLRENHRPASNKPFELTTLVVIGNRKSNYHTITTTMVPRNLKENYVINLFDTSSVFFFQKITPFICILSKQNIKNHLATKNLYNILKVDTINVVFGNGRGSHVIVVDKISSCNIQHCTQYLCNLIFFTFKMHVRLLFVFQKNIDV